jgi:hypothetical protein
MRSKCVLLCFLALATGGLCWSYRPPLSWLARRVWGTKLAAAATDGATKVVTTWEEQEAKGFLSIPPALVVLIARASSGKGTVPFNDVVKVRQHIR